MIAVGKEDLALYALSSFIHTVSDLFLSLYLYCAAQLGRTGCRMNRKQIFTVFIYRPAMLLIATIKQVWYNLYWRFRWTIKLW